MTSRVLAAHGTISNVQPSESLNSANHAGKGWTFSVYNPLLEIQNKIKHDKLVAHNKAVAKEKRRVAAIQAARRLAKQRAAIKTAQSLVPPPRPVYHAPTIVSGCGDNQYANFIYMHESGCNTGSVNAGGCRGIGQACPGSKLPCGAEYACQNRYFTSYALGRYGSWANAYSFWLGHHYW